MFQKIYTLSWNYIILIMPIIMIISMVFVWVLKHIRCKTVVVYRVTFAFWFGVMIHETLLQRKVADYAWDLRLFGSYIRGLEQSELYRANFMNVLLFFPGGILLTLSLGNDYGKWKRFFFVVLILCCLSSIVEIMQYKFARGMCETDDVFHNTLGAILGYVAGLLAMRISERRFVRRRE